ncbi:hypothetical protein L9F63_009281, partial [Diploptera punctata]
LAEKVKKNKEAAEKKSLQLSRINQYRFRRMYVYVCVCMYTRARAMAVTEMSADFSCGGDPWVRVEGEQASVKLVHSFPKIGTFFKMTRDELLKIGTVPPKSEHLVILHNTLITANHQSCSWKKTDNEWIVLRRIYISVISHLQYNLEINNTILECRR